MINKFIFNVIYKLAKKFEWSYVWKYSNQIANKTLDDLGVAHGKCTFYGNTHIRKAAGGHLEIGDNFVCQSGAMTAIDTATESKLQVEKGGRLVIGNNVGISSTIIHAWESVTIDHHVNIGAGCLIFDTNFHALDPAIRSTPQDSQCAKTAPVHIKEHAFIGARSIITKGVTIGCNSIVAAGSVVVKDIPDNEIWGGNPAQFIKKLND